MRQGDNADCMFILLNGEVGVYVGYDDTCVAVLKDNKVFGERALEHDDKRTATIIAQTDTQCLILMKKDYKDIIYVILLTMTMVCIAYQTTAKVQENSVSLKSAFLQGMALYQAS